MDAIADHLWQSTIFAVAAGMMALMLRNNGASARYWIWFAASAKFLVPLAVLTAAANQIPLPQASVAAGVALDAATLVFRTSAIPQMSGATAASALVIWLLGTAGVLARSGWQWQRLAADARRAPPIVDGVVFESLRRIESAEGIGPTAIVAVSGPLEPGVIGAWKPVLMWPRHLTAGLSDTQVDTVITHEVCHIVRRDNLMAWVQIVVSAVFWFHPLVWWIGKRLVEERERACDERVLALGRRPSTYGESILKTCQLCIASPLISVPGVTGGDLKKRIARIMRNEPSSPLNAARKAALLMSALTLLMLPTAAGVSACRPQRSVQAPKAARLTMPKLIRESKPQYTPRAMQEKIQGDVLMECVVKADGTVGDKKILKSLHPDLDQAALDAAANWLFEPGTRNGKPANVAVTITMSFTLK